MTFTDETDPVAALAQKVLPDWIERTFGERPVGPVQVIRAYTNVVFDVRLPTGRWVVKVWGEDWRTRDEIAWELEVLKHLDRTDIDVCPARAGVDGVDLQRLDTGSGPRWAVMFPFAPGDKPRPPFTEQDYRQEGTAVARLHSALEAFRPTGPDRPLGLPELIDAPLEFALTHCRSATTTRRLRSLAIDLHQRLAPLHASLDRGPVHGDLTFDNFHIAGSRFVWYDFDSGGVGYRSLDLQGWAAFDPANHPSQVAFLDGYTAVRPLSAADIAATPLLTIAQEFWSLDVELRFRVIARGMEAIGRYLEESASAITTMLTSLPQPRLAID